MEDINVLEYTVGKGRGHGWTVIFNSVKNVPLSNSNKTCIGFQDDEDHWVVFEIDSKTVKIDGIKKEYVYEASFLGYSPDTSIELEKVNFEWITDKEIIKEARKRACYT